jgi:hypothetical protein
MFLHSKGQNQQSEETIYRQYGRKFLPPIHLTGDSSPDYINPFIPARMATTEKNKMLSLKEEPLYTVWGNVN